MVRSSSTSACRRNRWRLGARSWRQPHAMQLILSARSLERRCKVSMPALTVRRQALSSLEEILGGFRAVAPLHGHAESESLCTIHLEAPVQPRRGRRQPGRADLTRYRLLSYLIVIQDTSSRTAPDSSSISTIRTSTATPTMRKSSGAFAEELRRRCHSNDHVSRTSAPSPPDRLTRRFACSFWRPVSTR